MSDGEEAALDKAGGVFPVFGGVPGIGDGKTGRIGEDRHGLGKIHAVFGEVAGGLGGVPLELHV
jgi:hypothetical protein